MAVCDKPITISNMATPDNSRRVRADTIPHIARRLRLLRVAIEGDDLGAQARFCRTAGITTQAWNNYEKERGGRIGLDTAIKLVSTYHVTLDWIYFGNESFMPHALVEKIRACERRDREAS
jgi:DNA-binding XRE family transcriptional regulator